MCARARACGVGGEGVSVCGVHVCVCVCRASCNAQACMVCAHGPRMQLAALAAGARAEARAETGAANEGVERVREHISNLRFRTAAEKCAVCAPACTHSLLRMSATQRLSASWCWEGRGGIKYLVGDDFCDDRLLVAEWCEWEDPPSAIILVCSE